MHCTVYAFPAIIIIIIIIVVVVVVVHISHH